MADDSTIPPIDARTLAAALDYREAMKESGDMAKIMLRTFKDINGMLDKNTENIDKSRSFQKEILSDAKARAMIQERVSSNISKLEDDILKLKVEQASVEYILKDLEKDAVAMSKKKIDLETQLSNVVWKRRQIEDEINLNTTEQIDLSEKLADVNYEIESLTRSGGIVTIAMLRKRQEAQSEYNASVNLGRGLIAEGAEAAKKENDTRTNQLDTESKITENLAKQSRLRGGAISKDIEGKKNAIAIEQSAARSATYQAGFLAYMKDTAASSGGVLGNLGGMLNKGKDIANSFKKIPNPFILLKTLLETGLDLFVKLDKAAENFRKETGFSNTQMVELRTNAESVNREFQQFGIGIEESYKSAKALTDVFGRTSLVTKEALGNVALLAANLGVAESDSANVLANFQGLGKATQEAAMNVIKVGAGISEKAGIPFKLVMNDIANASEQTTAMLGANPSKLMKSAIAARALGTDMNKIVSSQRKLLDYSSSINDELETSALLGRSISFQKARQLAYDGDAVKAAKETLETVKRAGDFEKMSIYQREALAKASGMELKDLNKMMAVEKQRDAILFGEDQAAKDKLLAQEETLRNLEKENDLTKQSLGDANERAIKQQQIQGTVTKFKNLWDSIILQLGSVLEPIIRDIAETLVPIAVTTLPIIANIAKIIGMAFKLVYSVVVGLLSPFEGIFASLKDILGGSEGFSSYLVEVGKALDEYIVPIFKNLGGVIGSIGMLILKFVLAPITMIGDVIGRVMGIVVGLISGDLNIGDAIVETLKIIPSALWSTIVSSMIDVGVSILKLFGLDIPKGIIEGLKDLPGVVLDLLQSGFQAAWRWIDKHFLGHSPSELGEGIVRGIASVGGMLLDVLTRPFRTAMNFISDIFGGDGDIIDTIIGGIKMAVGFIFDVITTPFRLIVNFVSKLFGSDGGIGTSIIEGIKTAAGFVFDVLTFPFRSIVNFISGIFGGDGDLGTSIVNGIKSSFGAAFEFVTSAFSILVDGIKNIASGIFDFITSPFKKAFDFVKNLPLVGKLFGGSDDISKQAKPPTESFQNVETSSVIEVKYLDELRDVVAELTSAVANLGTKTSETATVGGTMNTSALEAKLDTLTNLLVGGAVRVYLDGKDVSAAMSATGR